jgi:hypothetical protein
MTAKAATTVTTPAFIGWSKVIDAFNNEAKKQIQNKKNFVPAKAAASILAAASAVRTLPKRNILALICTRNLSGVSRLNQCHPRLNSNRGPNSYITNENSQIRQVLQKGVNCMATITLEPIQTQEKRYMKQLVGYGIRPSSHGHFALGRIGSFLCNLYPTYNWGIKWTLWLLASIITLLAFTRPYSF